VSTLVVMVLVPAAIAFVAAPTLLYLWGRSLPSEHEASRSVRVGAARDAVYRLLVDVRAIPRWRKTIRAVDLVASEPRVRFREHGAQGALELEIEESVAPSKIVLRAAPARRMAFEGTWTYELADDQDGTRVTLTERGLVRSPLARLFARYVLGDATHVERTLAALAARFRR
jgi:uncharacterized protein YndB with AHSA1/START domain